MTMFALQSLFTRTTNMWKSFWLVYVMPNLLSLCVPMHLFYFRMQKFSPLCVQVARTSACILALEAMISSMTGGPSSVASAFPVALPLLQTQLLTWIRELNEQVVAAPDLFAVQLWNACQHRHCPLARLMTMATGTVLRHCSATILVSFCVLYLSFVVSHHVG